MLRKIAALLILSASVAGSALASPEQWIEVRSPHFTVLTDSNEREARHLADQFERMRWFFQTLTGKANVDPVAPIVVIATKNAKGFQALEPEAYLASGQLKLAGLFMRVPDKNYVLVRLDAELEHPFATVYHEYTHLQYSDAGAWMPIWLNEGLAEFLQNTDIHNKDVLFGQPSRDDVLYLQQNKLIPLPVLFKVDHSSPYYHDEQKGTVFYAESWALVHYLEFADRQNGTSKMTEYMVYLSRREDPVVAAEKAFGNLKQLQTALENYIARGSYSYLVMSSAAAPIDEASFTAKMFTPSEADAARADFLAYVRREKDARALLETVLKTDPNNAQAHETMGFLESKAGSPNEARKWYGEAVKLNSTNYLAYYNYALLLMGPQTIESSPNIEFNLRTAMKLNPRFFPACDLLANLLTSLDREDEALATLKSWESTAGSAVEAAKAEQRIKQIEASRARRAEAAAVTSGPVDVQSMVVDVVHDPEPKHPTVSADRPKHDAVGIIRGVQCSYPAMIEFKVEGAKKTVNVYNNNYYKLEFSALGFTPSGNLNPCSDIEGKNARVQYAESTDKTVDGEVLAVELRK